MKFSASRNSDTCHRLHLRSIDNGAVSNPMTLKLPHTLGPYQLTERIAVGGMAEIFLAQEMNGGEFGHSLVVKRMHEHLSKTQSTRARFDNEATLLEQIQHPAFVQLIDSGVDNDIPYLVFAHVDGQSLHELPKRQPEQAIAICADLCDALHHLHTTVRVAHCDVSPQNVMITRN
ncbi:MAG TPA: hypothetical protein EYN66_03335, partial [Myxococcales bacterium]|nr:hypothetical protein [Myxococcales bacterium]